MIAEFQGQYRWLSNFHLTPVVYEGQVYPSSENAYQAAKTLGDRSAFLHVTPGVSKKLGRRVKLRPDWEAVKVDVMRDVLRSKFALPDLAQMLLETGDQPLIEGNTWNDTFWGVCRGKGQNRLGLLLMEIRSELKAAQP